MCGACGRSVVSDPVLGPTRTLRQHLIVAQTINEACQSWPGAPKVAATSSGWLVSGPRGATEAVSTVEALWSTVLRGRPVVRWQDLGPAADMETRDLDTGELAPGDLDTGKLAPGDLDTRELALRVLDLGQEMAQVSATETDA